MKISDLIFRGGGLKRMASLKNAELYRQTPGKLPEIINIDLRKIFKKHKKGADLLLQEGDHLFVRYETEWTEKKKVTISGEVKYPGEYIVEKDERLSDVIRRAGGFTEKAYLEGAVFIRESVRKIQQKELKKFIREQEEALLREQESSLKGMSISPEERSNRLEALRIKKELLDMLATIETPGRVIIKLYKPEKLKNTPYDILLEDGDSLYIPQIPTTVQILGAVYSPISVLYKKGKGISYYIGKAGGFMKYADRKSIYVLRANGEVESKFVKVCEVKPGDTIVVPQELRYHIPGIILAKDSTQIFYQLSLGLAAFSHFVK